MTDEQRTNNEHLFWWARGTEQALRAIIAPKGLLCRRASKIRCASVRSSVVVTLFWIFVLDQFWNPKKCNIALKEAKRWPKKGSKWGHISEMTHFGTPKVQYCFEGSKQVIKKGSFSGETGIWLIRYRFSSWRMWRSYRRTDGRTGFLRLQHKSPFGATFPCS